MYNHFQNTIVNLNTAAGLQNNTVLSLCKDRERGLWLGLDKGIAYVSLSSAIRYYDGRKDNLGTIYTTAVYGEYKYLGTNKVCTDVLSSRMRRKVELPGICQCRGSGTGLAFIKN